MDEYREWASLEALVRDVAGGAVSPSELLETYLDRIAALEPSIRAFSFLDVETARAEARVRTQALSDGEPPGRLHGVPIGVKDIIDVEGVPTRAGSEVTDPIPAAADADVVAKLRGEGAVILGKTTTHEFAYGVVSAPTRNPWDHERIAGGSSGGSAAAVAAGMCPAGLGTDTAGSIRIPSSLCGTSGLVPRRGTISMDGILPLAHSLDRCGPMARSAEDLFLLWEVLSDLPTTERRTDFSIARPRRLGSVIDISRGVATAVESAIDVLAKLASSSVEADLDPFDEWESSRAIPMMVEAAANHMSAGWYPQRADRYSDETRAYLRSGEKIPATRYASALVEIARLRGRFMSAWKDADVLVLPATLITAPIYQEAIQKESGSERRPVAMTLTRLCGPINHCECAVVVVPCGHDDTGLPVGMQLVARDEVTALRVATAYQRETDHHRLWPTPASPT